MQREYLGYVKSACEEGMTKEEVQYLLTDIYNKSNTRSGKKILRLFAQGIGGAKKNSLANQKNQSAPIINSEYQNSYQYFKQQY